MIRLLADQNVPFASIQRLRDAGWDVAEAARGEADVAVLSRAAVEQRVILTFDRDFGRLALRADLPRPAGGVPRRMRPTHPQEPDEVLLPLLSDSETELAGRLTVIRAGRVRQRALGREA